MSIKDKEAYNAYMKNYQAQRYQMRHDEAINILGGKCVVCGTTETLEFSYINPETKSFNIAKRMTGINKEQLLLEVLKCELLCSEHHREKKFAIGGPAGAVGHGGGTSGKRNCKCEPCKAKKAEYMRNKNYKQRAKLAQE